MFGLFRKKKETSKKEEILEKRAIEYRSRVSALLSLIDRYPPGSTIEYLGVKLTVVSSTEPYSDDNFWIEGRIVCEYRDNQGVIRTHTFTENVDYAILSKL